MINCFVIYNELLNCLPSMVGLRELDPPQPPRECLLRLVRLPRLRCLRVLPILSG